MKDDYRFSASLYNFLFSRPLGHLRRDIRTYIFHRQFSRVLDMCCGTGEQLCMLDKPGMQLAGIDNSLAMLEQAKRLCPDHTELHYLDAEKDTFSDGSFDCAIVSLALHEKPEEAALSVYKNARNLVREKGSVIVADFSPPPETPSGFLIGKVLIPIIERCAGKDHYTHYTSWLGKGGLEGFLSRQKDSADIISQPLSGTILCCAVTKIESSITSRDSFGLLDLAFPNHHQDTFT